MTEEVQDGEMPIIQASQSKIYHAEPGVFFSIQTIAEQRAAAERRAA